MSSTRLLLTTCFAVGLLAAEDEPATGEPFAGYRQAIEGQLSAILEHEKADEVHENATTDRNVALNESKAGEIRVFAKRFWGGHETELNAALDRLQLFRPTLERILDIEGVPRELVAVVLIESGAKLLATSPRQARGLWQFIPETARQYGLTVSEGKDERVYVEAATRAAAHYLRDLHSHFGDWPLALAAYNTGQRSVEGALEKGRATTFWQLSSAGLRPSETRSYVLAVLAAMRLLGSPQPAVPAGGKAQRDDWIYASAVVIN
jgi:hypothetical protein